MNCENNKKRIIEMIQNINDEKIIRFIYELLLRLDDEADTKDNEK